MLRNLLKKSEPEIIVIKPPENHQNEWGGDGLVFYVKNGKGVLSSKYGYFENDALATLVYGDIPLIKFQGDGPYFRPTCEKLVAAGYGLNMSNQKVISELREVLNHKFVSLEESLENLKLLLGLLPIGYYALVDTELCPTNGNGEFFWKLNNTPTYNKASCPIDGYRAIAYHGYLCVLIDGHHKAVAAALDKKKLKALVIIPTSSVSIPNEEQNFKGGISINGVLLYQDELFTAVAEIMKSFKLRQLSKGETKKYLSMRNDDFDKNYEWPQEILEVEKVFPDA